MAVLVITCALLAFVPASECSLRGNAPQAKTNSPHDVEHDIVRNVSLETKGLIQSSLTTQARAEETLKPSLTNAMIQRSLEGYNTSQEEGTSALAVSVDRSIRRKETPTEAPTQAPVDTPTEAPTTLPTEAPTAANVDWSIRPHPYVEALKRDCAQDFKLHCAEFTEPSMFYSRMGCLEQHRKVLQPACYESAFGGTVLKPNLDIFHNQETFKFEANGLPISGHIGWITAPLFFNTPTRSPMFRTWFSYTEARKQPAPKGLLFTHFGGPAPSLQYGIKGWGAFSKDLQNAVLDDYDIVSVDQRGLGMSGFELLYDIDTNLLQNATPQQLWTHFGKQPLEAGSLTESLIVPELQAEFRTPCTFLRKSHFVEPKDWGDLKEVSTYLDRKAQFAARCNRAFERDDGEGGKYSPLQFVGTSALVRDTEWMRWSFGAPTITVLGLSYGTRVAAAYSAAFPHAVARAAVVGVMGPEPDLLQ